MWTTFLAYLRRTLVNSDVVSFAVLSVLSFLYLVRGTGVQWVMGRGPGKRTKKDDLHLAPFGFHLTRLPHAPMLFPLAAIAIKTWTNVGCIHSLFSKSKQTTFLNTTIFLRSSELIHVGKEFFLRKMQCIFVRWI